MALCAKGEKAKFEKFDKTRKYKKKMPGLVAKKEEIASSSYTSTLLGK